MDSSIASIHDYSRPPAAQPFASPPDAAPSRIPVARLNELDQLALLLIATKRATPSLVGALSPLRTFRDLPEREKIYVALATSDDDLLHFLHLSIAEAIDRLGWVDASAMVARWSKRRAQG